MQNQEPEVWISELEAAGWHKWRGHSTVWEAPDGSIFRGPYAAWKVMKSSSPAVAKEKP